MKIPLNVGGSDKGRSANRAQDAALEKDVAHAKRGDWEAKNRVVKAFTPLITDLAQKRAKNDTPLMNRYIDAGKEGVQKAIKKYRPGSANKFQLFVLDHIETSMGSSSGGKGGGFFSKLFGKG